MKSKYMSGSRGKRWRAEGGRGRGKGGSGSGRNHNKHTHTDAHTPYALSAKCSGAASGGCPLAQARGSGRRQKRGQRRGQRRVGRSRKIKLINKMAKRQPSVKDDRAEARGRDGGTTRGCDGRRCESEGRPVAVPVAVAVDAATCRQSNRRVATTSNNNNNNKSPLNFKLAHGRNLYTLQVRNGSKVAWESWLEIEKYSWKMCYKELMAVI